MTGPVARLCAGLLALLAGGAVLAQVPLTAAELGVGYGAAAWRLLGYFTILTALLAALGMALVAAGRWPGGERPSAFALAALPLYEVFLGLVYYLLLARGRALEGWALAVDTALHAALPAGLLLFWLAFAPKRGLRPFHALLWPLWPALYSLYALARGGAEGWYPYFFLDVGAFGPALVAAQVAALTGLLALMGLGLVAVARRLAETSAPAKL